MVHPAPDELVRLRERERPRRVGMAAEGAVHRHEAVSDKVVGDPAIARGGGRDGVAVDSIRQRDDGRGRAPGSLSSGRARLKLSKSSWSWPSIYHCNFISIPF